VGAGARLRVADREVAPAGQDARQELALQLLGAVGRERRAHGVEREEGGREARALSLVGEDRLLDRGAPLAAILPGPADSEPAVGAHLLERLPIERPAALAARDLGLQLGGHHRGEVAAQLLLERALLGGERDVHGASGAFLERVSKSPSPEGAATTASRPCRGVAGAAPARNLPAHPCPGRSPRLRPASAACAAPSCRTTPSRWRAG